MKKILLILCAVLAISGCSKKKKAPSLPSDLTGIWNIENITAKSAVVDDCEVDIWLQFEKSKAFTEYQKIGGAGRYSVYRGTLKASKGILTVTFEDGNSFGTWEYSVEGDHLTLSRPGETDIYVSRTEIPDEVINNIY